MGIEKYYLKFAIQPFYETLYVASVVGGKSREQSNISKKMPNY